MSELVVGSIAGLASNSYEVSIASGSTLDLANAKAGSIPDTALSGVPGLQLIDTFSFSGATSHTFGTTAEPIFPSGYKNFKLIISELAGVTANTTVYGRLCVDGVANTTTNHEYQAVDTTGGGISANIQAGQTSWNIGAMGYLATEPSPIELLIMNPNQAKRTSYFAESGYIQSYSGTRWLKRAGVHYGTNVFDGFQIYATYNLSGRISIYGYKEA